MYDLQPTAAALQQGSLNAVASIAGRLLDSGIRSLDICSAARQELLASLAQAQPAAAGQPPLDSGKAVDTLHRHSLALTHESLEALLALQEEAIRFFESHSHGLNAFVAHSIDKAGKSLPVEILPAVGLFRSSVANLDNALVNLAETAAQTASQIEKTLLEENAAQAQKSAAASRRKSA
ncbi:hypothetical protein AZSI13_06350 [Azospira sp. I13]|uniref:hypothetical protein n=1 Tax=Azospira sp. I13 TaxID=1765050 RepID=UPI000D441FB8|nr:hypothetical protein [Azospira sp. I13]GBG01308.1 hypothetical protein AZSI13_06350 [Azospira sp. I13]